MVFTTQRAYNIRNKCNVRIQYCCLLNCFFLFQDLNNLKVETIIFKARQNILPSNLSIFFKFGNINIYNARQSDGLKQKIARANHNFKTNFINFNFSFIINISSRGVKL